jgi:hypothetical protein
MSKKRSCLHSHKRAYNCVVTRNTTINYFITATNTFWLYPAANINSVLSTTTYTQIGNRLIFATKTDLNTFYDNVFNSTAVSQPVGNQGYSLGVGTIVKDLQTELNLELANGQLMVKWRLVQQITNQSSLPSGGNSPNNTVGYATIISNWSAQDFANDANLDNLSNGHLIPYSGPV